MTFTGSEYISIEKAVTILRTSNALTDITDVKDYIEGGQLKAFMPLPDGLKLYSPIPLSEMLRMIELTGELRWIDNNLLFCGGIIFNKDGAEVHILDKDGAEVHIVGKGEIHVSKIMVRRIDVDKSAQTKPEPADSGAAESLALKSLQTKEIDKQIDAVCRDIDTAIEKHLRGTDKRMIVNHIQFLRDAGIADNKRAKNRVKSYIETLYGGKGYSGLSRRPSQKDGYFCN